MSARSRASAGILGLLLGTTGAGASAAPAEEVLLDMAIAVHPQSERGSPAETAARVGAMLDEATRVVEGIDGVPPGQYNLRVWHEHATEQTLKKLSQKIVVGPDGANVALLRISESGYLQIPHKNKYGLDYPPAGDEHMVYPGVRK